MSIINLFQQPSGRQCQLSVGLPFPPETWSGPCWWWDNSRCVTSPLFIPHTWIQALCALLDYFLLTADLVDLFITAVLCGGALRLHRNLPREDGSTWGLDSPPQTWWLCSLGCAPPQQRPHPLHASIEDVMCMWVRTTSLHGLEGASPRGKGGPCNSPALCPCCSGFLTVIICYPFKWKLDCSVLNLLVFFFFNRVSLGHEYKLCW